MYGKLMVECCLWGGGAIFLGKKRSTSTKLHSNSVAEIGMGATSK